MNLSAKTDVNKFAIAAAGGIQPLVALLGSDAPEVVTRMTHECAAAVLCNLAFNNENRQEIARAGAIPLLVKASLMHPILKAPNFLTLMWILAEIINCDPPGCF